MSNKCGLCYGDEWIQVSIADYNRLTAAEQELFPRQRVFMGDRVICPRCRPNNVEAPCQTCNEVPEECAKVPGLRHCEKANRSSTREER